MLDSVLKQCKGCVISKQDNRNKTYVTVVSHLWAHLEEWTCLQVSLNAYKVVDIVRL